MYVNNPFNKKCSWGVFNFCWELDLWQVVCFNQELFFLFSHRFIDVSSKFWDHLWVTQVKLIGKDHVLAYCLPISDQSFFEEIWNTLVSPVSPTLLCRLVLIKIVTGGFMAASSTLFFFFVKLYLLTLQKSTIVFAVEYLLCLSDWLECTSSGTRSERLDVWLTAFECRLLLQTARFIDWSEGSASLIHRKLFNSARAIKNCLHKFRGKISQRSEHNVCNWDVKTYSNCLSFKPKMAINRLTMNFVSRGGEREKTYLVIEIYYVRSFRIRCLIWALSRFSFTHSWSWSRENDCSRVIRVDFTSEFSTLWIACLLAGSRAHVGSGSLLVQLRFLRQRVFIESCRVLQVFA